MVLKTRPMVFGRVFVFLMKGRDTPTPLDIENVIDF